MNVKALLEARYTCTNWSSDEVHIRDTLYVLECAAAAPGKLGMCDYNIIRISDSDAGKQFKKWLYYSHGWNSEGSRKNLNGKIKSFVGQYAAPELLIWISHYKDVQTIIKDIDGYDVPMTTPSPHQQINDTFISATCAMIAAQEKGLQTGFANCFDSKEVAEKLGYPGSIATIALGIGYEAEIDEESRINKYLLKEYDDKNSMVGTKLDNIKPGQEHFNRHNKTLTYIVRTL